ncbi:MAG: right-handed parallel beta-helix repeat-containing protein [Chloroflexi bacterium]|nr:right-handed parallel beta-helix repeat-containing protein [Chloroflexota bacterium]
MMRRLIFALMVLCLPAAMATNYAVDHTKTGGANDGGGAVGVPDTADAWLTLESFIENAAAAGDDTCFVRATHLDTMKTEWSASQDGTAGAPIVVWADDGTVWPSSPSGTPTITCNANCLRINADEYWHIHGLAFDTITAQAMWLQSCQAVKVTNCNFTNFAAGNDYGIKCTYVQYASITDCVFDGGTVGPDDANQGTMCRIEASEVHARKLTINDALIGIDCYTAGRIYIRNSDLGQDRANTTDFTISYGGGIYGMDVACNTADDGAEVAAPLGTPVQLVNLDASKRPVLWARGEHASIDSDYGIVHSGGADYSLKLSSQTVEAASIMAPWEIMLLAVHADSAESRDYTIWAYRDVNFPEPAAANLFLEVMYWDADTLKTSVSTATIANDSTWTALTVSGISPNHAGPVTCRLVLKTWDADGYLYFDAELVATGEDYNATFLWARRDLAYHYTAPSGGQVIIIN